MGTNEEVYTKRSKRSKVNKDKGSNCKFPPLKLVLIFIIFGTFVTLLYSPEIYNNQHLSHSGSRWTLGGVDPRYISNSDIDWNDIARIIEQVRDRNQYATSIGLLNFNKSDINHWKEKIPRATHVSLHLSPVDKNMTWNLLYPEWIDEEGEKEVPKCPYVPKIKPPKRRLDVIAVKLPCRTNGVNWSRDVARMHLQVAAAGLAASAKGDYPVYLIFVTDCFPIPNLFTCKELVAREENVWLYKPNLNVLREKMRLPIGSCELAIPLRVKESVYAGNPRREAYATILHSAHIYVCGAIAAAQSIRMVGSTRDLIILVDETISPYHISGLEAAGWKIRTIKRIRNPKAEKDSYNEYNYSKFRLWQLTDYEKIIFIDADLLILRNIDFLFGMPEISATGNNASLFNSGVMVVEPSNCTFKLLMDHINEIESYNGGDQGYLNEIFTSWHRIPKQMNFLKHFWIGDADDIRRRKTKLFGASPPILYVIHYLGLKPWLCFRDYDCNWNVDILQEFASDAAHDKWWSVHDSMPTMLQQFCLLRTKQKAQLEWDRKRAEESNFTDGHWRIKVKDRRMKICTDKICSWKGMLRHWGESNWTDDEFLSPSPPLIKSASLLS